MNDACLIDGFGPVPLVRPASVADLGEIVRRAAADNTALYPVGGGTQLGLGNPPTKPGSAVDLRSLDQIIDFPARDMTVTVQAGITMAKLQAALAKENLRLPIDVPNADRATLGGIIATNTSGPRRYGFGTLRDYVIGISAINDEGNEFKAGGRVVKNVAGYDICKLLVGSLGTLGIITQVTLKLRPLPEEQALVTLGCDHDWLTTLLDQLHASRTRPVCLDLLNQAAARHIFAQAKLRPQSAPWIVVVGYEGNAAAVQWQVEQLIKEVGQVNQLEAYVGFPARPLETALIAQPERMASLQASTAPSAIAEFCRRLNEAIPRPLLHAHAGNGIVRGYFAVEDPVTICKDGVPLGVFVRTAPPNAVTALLSWRQQATSILCQCPSDWKANLDVWGSPPAAAWLMREIKKKFDPQGIFNPGRFVDGI